MRFFLDKKKFQILWYTFGARWMFSLSQWLRLRPRLSQESWLRELDKKKIPWTLGARCLGTRAPFPYKRRPCCYVACERQTFLLAHRCWETFREEERLRLSDRNSILMTQNLSGIRSEALIGRRSRFIVLAIVYKWQTKDKRLQRSNVNAMNL